MSAHTPGPWALKGWCSSDDYGWTVVADQRIVLDAESSESEANAHLIAAAPDLLAALQAAEQHIGEGLYTERSVLAVIRKALKKAVVK